MSEQENNVFISWSGERGKKIAQLLHKKIPCILQAAHTFYSEESIRKGTRGISEILNNLKESVVGIVCLTPECLHSDWLLFESGAIANSLPESKVCTLLFELEPADVPMPLGIYQHTKFNKKEFKKLFETINESLPNSLSKESLEDIFNKYWDELHSGIEEILKDSSHSKKTKVRSTEDKIDEILEILRSQNRKGKEEIIGNMIRKFNDAAYPLYDMKVFPPNGFSAEQWDNLTKRFSESIMDAMKRCQPLIDSVNKTKINLPKS